MFGPHSYQYLKLGIMPQSLRSAGIAVAQISKVCSDLWGSETLQVLFEILTKYLPLKKKKIWSAVTMSSVIAVHKFYFSLKPRLTLKFTASSPLVDINWLWFLEPLSASLEHRHSSNQMAPSSAQVWTWLPPAALHPACVPLQHLPMHQHLFWRFQLHFESNFRFFHSQLSDIFLWHHAPWCTSWDSLFNIT